MLRRYVPALVAMMLVAGCVGGFAGDAPETTSTTTTTTPATTTTSTTATTESSPGKGTMYLSVVTLENQSSYVEWPQSQRVQFENLSAARREEFLRALEAGSGQKQIETDAWSRYNESRPRVVRYDGTWYYVRILIV